MSRFWNPLLEQLAPYQPGEQASGPGWVKLNTNESPLGPSEQVLTALRAAADARLRLYPDPDSAALCAAFATALALQPQQVFVGNGSDEVLAHVFRALFRPSAPVLFPDISYSFYPVFSALFQLEPQAIALNADYSIDLKAYRRDNGGIIFANPNAPTGIFTPLSQLRALLQVNTESVVVVDEAYIDFGGESACTMIDRYPNLLVVQTLSKSRALAGLRVGAAFGHADLISGLRRVKNSFNCYPLGCLAEAAAVAALADRDWFAASCRLVIDNRETLRADLQARGFEVLPSAANFLCVRHPQQAARALCQALRERQILVRHFDRPRLADWLRISIGTEEQMAALLGALDAILAVG